MKKLIALTTLITCLSLSGYSQIEKKTLLLGGYSNLNFGTSNNSYFSINPNTGLFLSDKFCLGLSLPIIYLNESFYYGISPFARYYLKSKESRSLFFSTSLGLTSFIEDDNTLDSGLISAGVGHVWLFNESVGFETEFVGSTNFDNINFGLLFGFQIYFNRNSANQRGNNI
jgi:hypothetical protein